MLAPWAARLKSNATIFFELGACFLPLAFISVGNTKTCGSRSQLDPHQFRQLCDGCPQSIATTRNSFCVLHRSIVCTDPRRGEKEDVVDRVVHVGRLRRQCARALHGEGRALETLHTLNTFIEKSAACARQPWLVEYVISHTQAWSKKHS